MQANGVERGRTARFSRFLLGFIIAQSEMEGMLPSPHACLLSTHATARESLTNARMDTWYVISEGMNQWLERLLLPLAKLSFPGRSVEDIRFGSAAQISTH